MSSQESRELWPSRLSFILASVGSAVGIGNLLRYPSIAWQNYGLQWFIPYLFALFTIGIPLLLLEIAMGQSYRSSNIVALGRINHRLRGTGLASILHAYVVATYYNVLLSWIMKYLVRSFQNPLPWKENPEIFFKDVIVDNSGSTWASSNFNIIWETWGWAIFVWVLVFLSIFKGVNALGKLVYFTMGVPMIMLVALVIRGVTLENASDGIRLYIATWRGELLGSMKIWQAAIAQVIFSSHRFSFH
jgi:solute carrier family 6 GABA transporter-like protein 1